MAHSETMLSPLKHKGAARTKILSLPVPRPTKPIRKSSQYSEMDGRLLVERYRARTELRGPRS
jgi:hypothetical protein